MKLKCLPWYFYALVVFFGWVFLAQVVFSWRYPDLNDMQFFRHLDKSIFFQRVE